MADARILCVDDDSAQLTIISGVLKKEGYQVETATDGSQGLKKAQEWKPDLIVLDIMMPGMDGYQVCNHLKNDSETATNGSQGLKKAQEWKPDLIVLDIMMPGMDGYQVCNHLKNDSETAKIGVLMLTAKGGVDDPESEAWKFAGKVKDRMKGFDSGALEFLTKPVKAKDLVQRVKAVLWVSGIGG